MNCMFDLIFLSCAVVSSVLCFGSTSPASRFIAFATNRSLDSPNFCDTTDFAPVFAPKPTMISTESATPNRTKAAIPDPPPMATFDEWTKERLKQQPRELGQNSANGNTHSTNSGTDDSVLRRDARINNGAKLDRQPKRNYASKECGAKVLYSNSEMQNRGAVLNDKERDQYMRNPCQAATDKFLIAELCETIQATQIQIANFELFSSGPRDFRVSVAERSPSADWVTVGEYKAGDNRDVQTFVIANNRIYSKFVRIELLTHYGNEHYCTLSVLRVFGISMVDEYEAEAVALGDVAETQPVAAEPQAPKIAESEVEKAARPAEGDNSSDDNIVNKVVVGTIGGLKNALKTAFSWSSGSTQDVRAPARWKMIEQCWMSSSRRRKECRWFCYVFANFTKMHAKPIPTETIKNTTTSAQCLFLKIVTSSRQCKKDPIREEVAKTENTTARPAVPSVRNTFVPKEEDRTLPASSTNHKESVFLKLNKRITSLELNMSLSSEYLSELSRRYVQQTEDMRKQNDRMLKNAEDAAIGAVSSVRDALTLQVKQLREEMASLKRGLEKVQTSTVTTAEVARRTTESPGPLNSEDEFEIDDQDLDSECFKAPPEPVISYLRESFSDLWKTNQVICVVIVSHAFSILLFYTFYATSSSKCTEQKKIEELERRLEALADLDGRRTSTTNTDQTIPNGLSANQRKRLRKKLRHQQTKVEEWDSLSSVSPSTGTLTRYPSDHSADEKADEKENVKNINQWQLVQRTKLKKGRN